MQKKYLFIYSVAFFLFLSLAIYAYYSNLNSFKRSQMIAHTHEVLYNIEELLRMIVDMETGQRGYSITMDENFLEPAVNSMPQISSNILELRDLVSDNPFQLSKIDTLENLIQKKTIFIDKLITLSKRNQPEMVKTLIKSLEGKTYMDEIRLLIFAMKEEENNLLTQRLIDTSKAYQSFSVVYIILMAAFSTMITGLFYMNTKGNVKLRNAATELNQLYNNAPYGYYSLNKSGEIIKINDTALGWLGYTRPEILGKNIKSLMVPIISDNTHLDQSNNDLAPDREYHLKCKNGYKFPVMVGPTFLNIPGLNNELNNIPLLDNTKVYKLQLQISELTKDLEKQVRGLEEANSEIESLAYSISHDLRAPLRAINGYTSIIHEEYDHKMDEEGRRILGIILKNTQRMTKLIDDLLVFSQIGKKELIRIDCDMDQMVKTVVKEQLNHIRTQKKIDVQVSSLGKASVDLVLIKHVWNNLISNALKFSSTKDEQIIRIGKKIENGLEIFYVEDNGVGFDMFYVHKLFGVFQRLHKQKEFEGTGVGLAIVQRIIHKHDGKIWSHSQVGMGAGFYFTIPNKV